MNATLTDVERALLAELCRESVDRRLEAGEGYTPEVASLMRLFHRFADGNVLVTRPAI